MAKQPGTTSDDSELD